MQFSSNSGQFYFLRSGTFESIRIPTSIETLIWPYGSHYKLMFTLKRTEMDLRQFSTNSENDICEHMGALCPNIYIRLYIPVPNKLSCNFGLLKLILSTQSATRNCKLITDQYKILNWSVTNLEFVTLKQTVSSK